MRIPVSSFTGDNYAVLTNRRSSLIVFCRVGSLPQLQDQAEIIWANLLTWGFWNSRDLRRRWNDLQESIEGYEDKTHQGQRQWD